VPMGLARTQQSILGTMVSLQEKIHSFLDFLYFSGLTFIFQNTFIGLKTDVHKVDPIVF
jgi:hypothetical protein